MNDANTRPVQTVQPETSRSYLEGPHEAGWQGSRENNARN